MSLGTYLYYETSILGWFGQPGRTCEKKFGADYEQLLRPLESIFYGGKTSFFRAKIFNVLKY